ncbi:hypothetical protein B0H66DRAFT_569428 [Apodospora peruviana]|uniref:NAD(P)-binding domain-containing protein n=1 Tax=Apodospora peruviana TaxID=516989 RepID=A0AAE0HUB4_9PEZI|nr:hypothetical protein B0H66DRAFT_569428 [Apodospora peruviana]
MAHHVLLLGGHGKIAQHLTPLLLRRSWQVTSIIRNPDQVSAVEKLSADSGGGGGKLTVLVRSLEDIKSEAQAQLLIDEVKPDYVVWSAGAGGKGGLERTYAIDRDAATHFIHAAAADPSVTRFLMVSYLGSRHSKPAWWSEETWQAAVKVNKQVLPTYFQAKVAADYTLYEVAKKRESFAGICLRPGTLSDEPAGPVELGKTKLSTGKVSRESVARVADLLLANKDVKSAWVDMLDGDEKIADAVERVVKEGVDASEGEKIGV